MLAQLFCRPANLLVLDEPTNDLDLETLELLEEVLLDFDGTVLLVSHDREFMDNTVTSLLVLDGQGGVEDFVGSFSDWEAAGGSLVQAAETVVSEPEPEVNVQTRPGNQELSQAERRELKRLPARIEKLEQEQAVLEQKMADPGFFSDHPDQAHQASEQLAALQQQLEKAYQRWAELE